MQLILRLARLTHIFKLEYNLEMVFKVLTLSNRVWINTSFVKYVIIIRAYKARVDGESTNLLIIFCIHEPKKDITA